MIKLNRGIQWVNGQVVTNSYKHSVLKKVIGGFFDGEEFELSVNKPVSYSPLRDTDWTYTVELSVEAESYIAWEMFSDLKDTLTSQGCKCDFRVRIDL